MTGITRMDRVSGAGTEAPELSDATFQLLRDVIEARTGVFFSDEKRGMLADKLSELVVSMGMSSYLEYYYALRYDDAQGSHTAALFDRLAVPETYFWRQAEHFNLLGSVIAPRFFERHPERPLRVWSAACCTGEEPVSIAIALAEAGLLESRPVEIIGSDASRAMIAGARAGVYQERSFRQLPRALRDKYFDADLRGGWRPRAWLTERIAYEVASLTDPLALARLATADVIFCRNVFIYFADETVRSIVTSFGAHMPDDGYLFVGAAESLTRLGVDFELAQVGDAFVYVRAGMRAAAEAQALPRRSRKS
jgi:chemotaxis protein methyltransferase CheR